jgi:hypothetical protein
MLMFRCSFAAIRNMTLRTGSLSARIVIVRGAAASTCDCVDSGAANKPNIIARITVKRKDLLEAHTAGAAGGGVQMLFNSTAQAG